MRHVSPRSRRRRPRRTQALSIGLEGTEPFHWGGDMADMSHLVQIIRDGRMNGPRQSRQGSYQAIFCVR